MNHNITFLKEEYTTDPVGNNIVEWVPFKKAWCAIKTVKGQEYFEASQYQKENTYRFIIRYTEGLNPRMNIDYKGRTFEIESILNDDETNRTMTVIAHEKL